MKNKPAYRIRNWREYDTSLRERGSLTFWLSTELIDNWTTKEKTGGRGASPTYTDAAIETLAIVKYLFRQANRQAEGLLSSIFELMKLSLPVPGHTTLARRLSGLEVRLPVKPKEGARHVVCDSTGVKVYGEGEWKVRMHGVSKRRTWRKLHFCVDESSLEIVVVGGSTNSVSDGEMLPLMLAEVGDEVSQVSADGIYDQRKCYEAIRGVQSQSGDPAAARSENLATWQHGC